MEREISIKFSLSQENRDDIEMVVSTILEEIESTIDVYEIKENNLSIDILNEDEEKEDSISYGEFQLVKDILSSICDGCAMRIVQQIE